VVAAAIDNQPLTEAAYTFSQALAEAIAQQVAEFLRSRPGISTDCHPPSPWLTLEQAAGYMGFSRDSLYKLTAARAIPARKKSGGQGLRFHRDELDEWMLDHYPRLDRAG
jgi:excisionase family DNA binding protein